MSPTSALVIGMILIYMIVSGSYQSVLEAIKQLSSGKGKDKK